MPEVEQGDAAVLGQEDVAGVGIGMEEAVDQDLLEIGPEELLGQRGAVSSSRTTGLRVVILVPRT